MFEYKSKVTVSSCDIDGNLKLYSALQMMQDCSELWKDSEPACNQYFEENNIALLLASRQVEIVRVPKYKENLTVRTSVFESNQNFGFRNTFIYDEQGEVCYKSWSVGAFVDKTTGRLSKLSNELISTFNYDPKLEMNYQERKIILPKIEAEVLGKELVKYNDIDYNRHMNNANYIRHAVEALPDNFCVKNMRVEFKRSAKQGDELTITRIINDNFVYIAEYLGDKVSAVVEFEKH